MLCSNTLNTFRVSKVDTHLVTHTFNIRTRVYIHGWYVFEFVCDEWCVSILLYMFDLIGE